MYYGLTDIPFWLLLLFFIPVIFISFYFPADFLVLRFKITSKYINLFSKMVIGMVMWAFQGYIFGYLNVRYMTIFYFMLSIIYAFYKIRKTDLPREISNTISLLKKEKIIIALIIFGSLCQLVAIFPSGLAYTEGVKFFGNNAADGLMHVSYIRSIVDNFPPQEPGFSGHLIRNYHYWSDMLMADIVRIFKFPILNLYFQYMPLYLSMLTGVIAYMLVNAWGGSKKMALIFVFLLYFASDAAYLVLLILQKPIGFYTPAIDSGVIQFLNMPHVFGKLVFLTGMIAFHFWIKEKSLKWAFLTLLLFSSLFGFKIYFGIFVVIGLVCYLGFNLLQNILKREFRAYDVMNIILFLGFIAVSFAIFFPHNYGAGGFVFVYLEWPRSLLGYGSIDWQDWWLRRQVYVANNNLRNIAILDIIAVMIALVSIYGTRILGFITTKKLLKFIGFEKTIFLIPGLIIFHILGFFTIQKSGGVNVFNFFSVSSVILSLFSAFILSRIKSKLGFIFILFFIGLTIPRSIYEINSGVEKIYSSDFRLVSNDEIQAMNFISQVSKKNDIVQPSPFNSLSSQTPYVPFFTQRQSYLSGEGLLSTHNIDISSRKKELEEIFNSNEIVDFTSKLSQRGISYVYLQKKPEEVLKFKVDAHLNRIFENKSVIVFKIN